MRTSFYGFGAYLARVKSQTECDVWTDDPMEHGFSAEPLAVDLGKNVHAVLSGRLNWAAVEVDDHANLGGGTTIGPLWPEGLSVGALYLADSFLATLNQRPTSPEIDGHPYELVTVVYHETDDPRASRRYRGYHARVLERTGARALVDIFPAGSSKVLPPLVRRWIDLDSPEVCDAGSESMTAIRHEDEGAVFLGAGLLVEWSMENR